MQHVNVSNKNHHPHDEARKDVHSQKHQQRQIAAYVFAHAELHKGPTATQVLFQVNADQRRQLPRVYVITRQRGDDQRWNAHEQVSGSLSWRWASPAGGFWFLTRITDTNQEPEITKS